MRGLFMMVLSATACLPGPLLAQPVFEVRGGSFAPGTTEGVMDIWLRPEQGKVIAGWSLILRYDPSVIGGVSIEGAPRADIFAHKDQSLFTEPGTASAVTVYSLLGDKSKMVFGPGAVVARVRFCVLSTAVEGDYLVEVIPVARTKDGALAGPDVFTTVTVFDEMGPNQSVEPLAENGVIEVTGPIAPGGACSPDAHVPPIDVPAIGYTWKAPGIATPNAAVSTWVEVSTNVPLVGYSCAMRFDPAVLSLQAIDVNKEWLAKDTSFEHVFFDAGDIGIAAVTDLYGRLVLPSGTRRLAALSFDVRPDSGPGSTVLDFVPVVEREWEDTAGRNRIAFYNAVSLGGVAGVPGTDGASVEVMDAVAAHLEIQAEAVFRRGDADGDGELAIADAVLTLNHLFLGNERMPCADGADTDDSGNLDIADPIGLLRFLFHGDAPPAQPGPTDPGPDPTDDDLSCVGVE